MPSPAPPGRAVRFGSVDEWLDWQQGLNPRGIVLGLERCRPVARALGLLPLPFPVITVAGTNGKGSCVAMLEAVLTAAGYRVGAYTSPHLFRFNETIRFAAQAVSDEALLRAFEAVADARGEVMLTWFEFRTLAAALILRQAQPDVALLEVGLGGRLDAVNMFDPDVALIASIGVDHRDWLGESRDQIGREKAGICRNGRPAVCADPNPPRGLLEAVEEIGGRLYRSGIDYRVERGNEDNWRWRGPDGAALELPRPGIPGECQLGNAAAALMALHLLAGRFPLEPPAVQKGIAQSRLPGRQQIVSTVPEVWLDVAHNPQAAEALAESLKRKRCAGKTRAVFAVYADKDASAIAGAVKGCIDHWHLAPLPPPRGASAAQTAEALNAAGVGDGVSVHPDPPAAYSAARTLSAPGDRVVVFGSFETVRKVAALESW